MHFTARSLPLFKASTHLLWQGGTPQGNRGVYMTGSFHYPGDLINANDTITIVDMTSSPTAGLTSSEATKGNDVDKGEWRATPSVVIEGRHFLQILVYMVS